MSQSTRQEPKRRLGAVLFADVAGYSRLMGVNELDTHNAVMERIQRFRAQAPAHNGEILNITGDGVLAFFESITSAVRFAMDVQQSIETENEGLEADERISFRIGINLGDVIEEDGNVYGESVNIAARLEGLAQPGGICVTRAVYDEIKNRLPLGFDYLGYRSLKNISNEVEVYGLHDATSTGLRAPTKRSEPTLESVEKGLPTLPSVAVLPFKFIGENPTQEFLADGITEDIITNLSRFRSLFVIARGSAFFYKNQSPSVPEVSKDLGVQYLVQGSVRPGGKRLRISVFLVDALEGQTVWAETYDRLFDDVFEVQDEISQAAVSAMAVQIESAEQRRMRQFMPTDLEAYGLLLQGQQRLYRYRPEDNATARSLYEAALESDPGYARAMAAVSRTHNLDWFYSWSQAPSVGLDRALELAQNAISLDPSDARGHAELGYVRLYRKEHDLSISSYEKARDLNPNDADIMVDMADTLAHAGRSEESVPLFEKAVRLNPFYPDHYLWSLGGAYYNLKEYDEVVRVVSKMNNPAEGERLLAASFGQLGKMTEARHHAGKVLEAHPNFSIEHLEQVLPDLDPDETAHYVEGLKKAGL